MGLENRVVATAVNMLYINFPNRRRKTSVNIKITVEGPQTAQEQSPLL
jgi:hypothetical protein